MRTIMFQISEDFTLSCSSKHAKPLIRPSINHLRGGKVKRVFTSPTITRQIPRGEAIISLHPLRCLQFRKEEWHGRGLNMCVKQLRTEEGAATAWGCLSATVVGDIINAYLLLKGYGKEFTTKEKRRTWELQALQK
ncbi:hypothetical protein ACH5RR_024415 [Cinchona calisaya]|uniref:Uncharacterized protein n=1 Tax=Cinchona calisaya TaxID=153742 RepID=A0ABD2Z1P5_9GENT